MVQDIPNKRFDRNMNHNYMILSRCDFFGNNQTRSSDYRVRMLLENNIPGLLPVTHRMVDGESRYYYEINSLQSLDRLLDKKEIRYYELKALLIGCINLFDRLEEYLLDGTQIIIKSEYIYVNVERMEPYFVCYPDYAGDVRVSFMEFMDELLTKIDHTDESAVMLGYQVYRYTRNPNYVLSEVRRMMESVMEEMAESEADCKICKSVDESSREYEACFVNSSFHYENDNLYDAESVEEKNPKRKSVNKIDLIGGILCVFIALSAAAIIVGARILMIFELSGNQELYLYGAVAMAAAAAVVFFVCFVKKVHYDKEIDALQEQGDTDNLVGRNLGSSISDRNPLNSEGDVVNRNREKAVPLPLCNDTICLESEVIEERVLRGRMNGKEVTIALNHLPMTIGKLASFADYVINDDTVSKMHARFEEHNGRIYLCDLNSTNGTVKNGVWLDINTPVPLEPGDRLRFGRTSFTYC